MDIQFYYINLIHRTDRNKEIIDEWKKTYFSNNKLKRVEAIYNKYGNVGCGYSHISALEIALQENPTSEWVGILEDDIEFRNSETVLINVEEALEYFKPMDIDVLLLAQGKDEWSKYEHLPNCNYMRIKGTYTKTAYIIKTRYIPTLIANYKEALVLLEKEPDNHNYHTDMYWQKLHDVDKWYGFKLGLAHQRFGYSDCAKEIRLTVMDGKEVDVEIYKDKFNELLKIFNK